MCRHRRLFSLLAVVLSACCRLKTAAHLGCRYATTLPDVRCGVSEALIRLCCVRCVAQMRMFLTGSGGTGKSRVVQAVRDFARRWHATSMVCVSATSGTAAVNLNGSTYQSAVGFQFNGRASAPSSLYHVWRRIGLMIVDEVSLMKSSDLFRLHQRLGRLKQLPHLKFGGVHIAFMGDFHQLQLGNGVFVDPGEAGEAKGSAAADAASGYQLWRDCINCGFELTLPMRQASDTDFAAILERFRINRPTPDDIRIINSRVVSPDNRPARGTAALLWLAFPPVIVLCLR